VSRAEMAAAVGLPPFFLDDVLVPARRMSVAALRRSFERLYQADRAFKSSRVDPEIQLTRLVRQLQRKLLLGAPGALERRLHRIVDAQSIVAHLTVQRSENHEVPCPEPKRRQRGIQTIALSKREGIA